MVASPVQIGVARRSIVKRTELPAGNSSLVRFDSLIPLNSRNVWFALRGRRSVARGQLSSLAKTPSLSSLAY